jgi:hypothetical protein
MPGNNALNDVFGGRNGALKDVIPFRRPIAFLKWGFLASKTGF